VLTFCFFHVEDFATPNNFGAFSEVKNGIFSQGITQVFWVCERDRDGILTSQNRFVFAVEDDEPICLAVAKIHRRPISSEQGSLASTLLMMA